MKKASGLRELRAVTVAVTIDGEQQWQDSESWAVNNQSCRICEVSRKLS